MSDIATGKLVIWMRLQAKRITPDGNSTSIMLSAGADRLEQQEQRIAELERELKLREPMKPSALRKERDAAIYGACELRKEMIGLRRELAAAKADMNKVGNCTICAKNCKPSEIVAIVGNGEKCFEWRGAREGDGEE